MQPKMLDIDPTFFLLVALRADLLSPHFTKTANHPVSPQTDGKTKGLYRCCLGTDTWREPITVTRRFAEETC